MMRLRVDKDDIKYLETLKTRISDSVTKVLHRIIIEHRERIKLDVKVK